MRGGGLLPVDCVLPWLLFVLEGTFLEALMIVLYVGQTAAVEEEEKG